ncbi:phage antirepressor N-terminal domain-containing protein [Psychrobacter fozii]|uniref:P22-like antirepressor protein n=1 Tax=Psychrobacter fozii TaxID=198480 RepID=A0A2V4UIF9_9GAMM|nr:phage antirepressor N-terminal domain-containing protein [Psychrobacter fozii]PYE38639.1 P22-like antirepressor protein [Psychrobacter fozii]
MTYPINVSFYDDELVVINHNGEPYVPIKPIVENMGLDWKDQNRKVKARFESTVTILTTVAEDGKSREMICLPLRKLSGWLMTISPNKAKNEVEDKIIRYQNECDDVLWQYWAGKHQRIQEALNNVFIQENISQAKGSFHGKGLSSRKQEKQTNQRTILYLQTLIQPELTNFKTATKAVF